MRYLKKFSLVALLLVSFTAQADQVADASYAYPYSDPWIASVSRVLMGSKTKPESEHFVLMPGRQHVPWLETRGEFEFGYYPGKTPYSPLVIYLAGLGGHYWDGATLYQADVLRKQGYAVMILSSTMHWTFLLSASHTGYGGYTPDDAADLQNAIVESLARLQKEKGAQPVTISLVGLSLGGLTAAHLGALDAKNPKIGFNKVISINPPVRLLYGVQKLDWLYSQGDQWTAQKRAALMSRAVGLVTSVDSGTASDNAPLMSIGNRLPFSIQELQYLIGRLFRESLRDCIITSQQIEDRGILKEPANNAVRQPRETEAMGFSFVDYLTQFVYPAVQEKDGEEGSFEDLIDKAQLAGVRDYIALNPNYQVFDNLDDFLLEDQDIQWLQENLGARLHLYPHGGHAGNLWYGKNQQDLLNALAATK